MPFLSNFWCKRMWMLFIVEAILEIGPSIGPCRIFKDPAILRLGIHLVLQVLHSTNWKTKIAVWIWYLSSHAWSTSFKHICWIFFSAFAQPSLQKNDHQSLRPWLVMQCRYFQAKRRWINNWPRFVLGCGKKTSGEGPWFWSPAQREQCVPRVPNGFDFPSRFGFLTWFTWKCPFGKGETSTKPSIVGFHVTFQVISINFTPKTSHSCLKKWYFPMFSRYFWSCSLYPLSPTHVREVAIAAHVPNLFGAPKECGEGGPLHGMTRSEPRKKGPWLVGWLVGWLFDIGDDKLPNYIGIIWDYNKPL